MAPRIDNQTQVIAEIAARAPKIRLTFLMSKSADHVVDAQ
jgi:hypothetical protein